MMNSDVKPFNFMPVVTIWLSRVYEVAKRLRKLLSIIKPEAIYHGCTVGSSQVSVSLN